MKKHLKEIAPHVNLYRDDKTGIAWVVDGSSGCGHTCHSNIDATGSVRGMKKLGYWKKDARTVRSHGFIYNIDTMIVSDEYDKIAAEYCECQACLERKNALLEIQHRSQGSQCNKPLNLPAKGTLIKVNYDEPRYGIVVEVLSKEDTKEVGMMGQLIRLLMNDTGKEEDFTYGWEVLTIEDIAKEVEILEDTMEVTDSEGHSYDAICRYQGKEYCTYLSWDYQAFEGVSYEMQAAEDIYKQLSSKN